MVLATRSVPSRARAEPPLIRVEHAPRPFQLKEHPGAPWDFGSQADSRERWACRALPGDHLGVPLVRLGDAGKVGDGPARGPGPAQGERADVAALVDGYERVDGACDHELVDVGFVVAHLPAEEGRSLRIDGVGPMQLLAHVDSQIGVVPALRRCFSCGYDVTLLPWPAV